MNIKIVLDFISAINNRDIDKILFLLSENHEFIDSQGNIVTGKNNMKYAWICYFELFPDYKIDITEILENELIIGLFGFASGTYKNLINKGNSNYWKIPASWKAIVKDDKIQLWQVYADNSLPLEIVNRNK